MKDGEIVQIGTSEEILTEPANAYVERFVENVDRSKIITASSVMVDKPIVARLKKEGPEVLIRKMRERNLTVLPVVDSNNLLVPLSSLIIEVTGKDKEEINEIIQNAIEL